MKIVRMTLIAVLVLCAAGLSFGAPANVAYDMANMIPAPAGVAAPTQIYASEDGKILSYGTTMPTDATSGYAKGGLFIHTDGSAGTMAYLNEGTGTSSAFKALLTGTSAFTAGGAITFTALPDATTGGLIGTGGNWLSSGTAGSCGFKLLLRNTCATGEFATLRMRASANNTTASGNGGSSIGTTTCIDASASAYAAEYGNLFAVNACAQPNALAQTTDATNIVCALYGRIDATAASAGRRWVTWIDTHATTKAAGGDYMMRISHNGTIAIDGMMTVYGGGRLPVFLNVEDATPGFVGTQTGVSTVAKNLAIKINGTAYYIPLCSGTN